jgi:hypothetical protein
LAGSLRLYKRSGLEKTVASTESKACTFQMEMRAEAQGDGVYGCRVPISFVYRDYWGNKLRGDRIVEYAKGLPKLQPKVREEMLVRVTMVRTSEVDVYQASRQASRNRVGKSGC